MYPYICPMLRVWQNQGCCPVFENTQHNYEEDYSDELDWNLYRDHGKKPKKRFTTEEAIEIGERLGVDWRKFDVEQFRMGLDVELEHGRRDPNTDVTRDNPILTGKIALAHLNEFPDYYTRLAKLEKEAKAYWGTR